MYRLTSLQPYRPTGLQAYRLTGLQAYNRTGLQAYRLTGLQAYRLTGLTSSQALCRLFLFAGQVKIVSKGALPRPALATLQHSTHTERAKCCIAILLITSRSMPTANLEIGLVDHLGGLDAAVGEAMRLVSIGAGHNYIGP